MIDALLIGLMALDPPADGAARASSAARRSLAGKLAIAEEVVTVETVEAVDWPDASLGCPAKGELAAAVITPGYRVTLRANGQPYEVHVAGARARVCSPRSNREGSFPAAGVKVAGIARRDLASRLGVEPRQVQIVSIKPTTWPDGTLGCSGSALTAEPEPIKGFLVTLRARDTEYEYHADTERAVACPKE